MPELILKVETLLHGQRDINIKSPVPPSSGRIITSTSSSTQYPSIDTAPNSTPRAPTPTSVQQNNSLSQPELLQCPIW